MHFIENTIHCESNDNCYGITSGQCTLKINALWPSVELWLQRSASTFVQVMACYLKATIQLPLLFIHVDGMLTSYQSGLVAYIWEQFQGKCSVYQFLIYISDCNSYIILLQD